MDVGECLSVSLFALYEYTNITVCIKVVVHLCQWSFFVIEHILVCLCIYICLNVHIYM